MSASGVIFSGASTIPQQLNATLRSGQCAKTRKLSSMRFGKKASS